jgi:hypothetical protein
MTTKLPQKYQGVARALIPYAPDVETSGQMALIKISPALPCFICGQPATDALIAPAQNYEVSARRPWLIFPICSSCEERQVQSQSPG